MLNKKGPTLAGLQGVIWTLVIIGIMLVVGLTVLDNLMDTTDSGSTAESAANDTINAVADVADWLPVIVVIIIAAVILGLVYFFRQSGQ
jgi:hypothetical protein